MRSLNDYFDIEMIVADVSTAASLDMSVVPDAGKVTKALSVLYTPITVADANLYLFRGRELAISKAETADGGASVTFTVPAHGLLVGDYVYIKGSLDPNYNGLKAVTAVASATTFKVTATFTADETSAKVLRVIGNAGTTGLGKLTIGYSGAAAGDVDSITPSGGTCVLNEGDVIGVVSGAGSTTAAKAKVRVIVQR